MWGEVVSDLELDPVGEVEGAREVTGGHGRRRDAVHADDGVADDEDVTSLGPGTLQKSGKSAIKKPLD